MSCKFDPKQYRKDVDQMVDDWTKGQPNYDKELAAVMNQDRALNEILQERKRQDAKWGEQNHDDKTWLAILTEEVGEPAQAILHDEFGGKAANTARIELVQVAAVAVQWAECMGRRETAVSVED